MNTPISPPPGQGPIDPRGAFSPPPPPGQPNAMPPGAPPGGWQPPMMPPSFPGGPPPWYPGPPQPPRRRGGALRTLLTVIGVLVLLVSIITNVALIGHDAIAGGLGAAGVRETTLISGDSDQKVALIPIVNEMILESHAQLLDKMLEAAEKDASVKAVVLQIDTPGGAVTPSDEMNQRILTFKKRKPIPVVVTMGSLAASGGYYTACAADYLFAEPTTITGSIGVLMPRYNFAKLADKYGVEDISIHATGSPYKTAGSPLKPPTTQETEYLVGLIDADYTRFKQVVVAGRGSKLTQPITEIANGKAYTADEALKLGLVDAIGYPADAAAYAATAAKLSKMTLVKYDAPPTLLELFSSSAASLPPAKAAGGLQINGVQINAASIDSLLTPQLLYMWRGE